MSKQILCPIHKVPLLPEGDTLLSCSVAKGCTSVTRASLGMAGKHKFAPMSQTKLCRPKQS